jgi:hypothetical protein
MLHQYEILKLSFKNNSGADSQGDFSTISRCHATKSESDLYLRIPAYGRSFGPVVFGSNSLSRMYCG